MKKIRENENYFVAFKKIVIYILAFNGHNKLSKYVHF